MSEEQGFPPRGAIHELAFNYPGDQQRIEVVMADLGSAEVLATRAEPSTQRRHAELTGFELFNNTDHMGRDAAVCLLEATMRSAQAHDVRLLSVPLFSFDAKNALYLRALRGLSLDSPTSPCTGLGIIKVEPIPGPRPSGEALFSCRTMQGRDFREVAQQLREAPIGLYYTDLGVPQQLPAFRVEFRL